jgi:signal transduction histidine kinase
VVLHHRGKIAQVVVNLVHNAAQASPPGGEVAVVVDEEGGEARVAVRDRGPGMPPEVLAVVSRGEPFFTTKERGSGLGLSISRRIVAEHEGRLELRSRPGEGTEAILRLPLVAETR